MKLFEKEYLPKLPKMRLAVVGHLEWMTFLSVDKKLKPGLITHASKCMEEPAGGGAMVAIKLSEILGRNVHFFTALGKDELGRKAYEKLKSKGISLSVNWKDQPTRRGISIVDPKGERSITVIGERLEPSITDIISPEYLEKVDGIFITAGDVKTIQLSRKAKFLAATPRVGIEKINLAKVKLDALIGSGLDPDEKARSKELIIKPKLRIETRGKWGGEVWPGGKYKSFRLRKPMIDAYGCGDSFAAGVTAGLSAGWEINYAISLGANLGANCATHFGPYL